MPTSTPDEKTPVTPPTIRPLDIYKRRQSVPSLPRPAATVTKDVLSGDSSRSRALHDAFNRYSSDLHEPIVSALKCNGQALGFLNSSVESLTVLDAARYVSVLRYHPLNMCTCRLLAEYKYIAKACSVLLADAHGTQRLAFSPSADSLSESASS